MGGIEAFSAALSGLGSQVPHGTCAKTVNCDSTNPLACMAGNRLAELKQQLLTESIFRCDLFTDPGNPSQACDTKDMQKNANGVWEGDCMQADGSFIPMARTCTLG